VNILVDGILDNNLGDSIMVETLLRFLLADGHRCFLLCDDPFLYADILARNPAVSLLPSLGRRELAENGIKLFVRIGGSMFQHNTAREGLARYLTWRSFRRLKRWGVRICFLGCNVGPFLSRVGVRATKGILKTAELVTCRDRESYDFIAGCRKGGVHWFPDILFTRGDLAPSGREDKLLGVCVYTGYLPSLKRHNLAFCRFARDVAAAWLREVPEGRVRLFVFDGGYYSDYPAAHRILGETGQPGRVEIVGFDGDADRFMVSFGQCGAMLGARFHSVVLSALCGVPVLPVVYANKTGNLLRDLGFQGRSADFSRLDEMAPEDAAAALIRRDGLFSDVDPSVFQQAGGHLRMLREICLGAAPAGGGSAV